MIDFISIIFTQIKCPSSKYYQNEKHQSSLRITFTEFESRMIKKN